MIRLEAVDVGYTKKLFGIVNLTLEAGQVYALVGSNGSGKTTFLNGIIGEKGFLKGNMWINSRLFSSFNSHEIAQEIAFVGSKFEGVDFLTVQEVIALGRTPHTNLFGRLKKADIKAISHALEVMELIDFKDVFTTNLSDGERQLVAIARALAQETPIIVLDEPTAFLDYGNRQKIITLLSRLALKENKCIIFSSHDIELCIERGIHLLLINQQSKILESMGSNSHKDEIIERGFLAFRS